MSSNTSNPTPATASAPASPPPARRRKGPPPGSPRRPLARSYEPAHVPAMLSTREAADALRVTVEALRARCRRAAVVGPDGSVTAPLAPGVTAVKFGRNSWRVRFDNAK